MEKQFIQIQVALFFKSDYRGPFESVSLKLKELFGNDLNSQIIGLPDDAPSEIPRISSNSRLVSINFAKNRLDFFSKNQNFFTENVDKIFELIDMFSIKIGRVGIVHNYFSEISIEQFKSIFKTENVSINNPKEITIRLNELVDINTIRFNDSEVFTSGFIKDSNGIQKNGLIITKDTNSLQEDLHKNNFSKESLGAIYKEVSKLKDKIFFQ